MHQPDHEAQAGSIGNTLEKAPLKKKTEQSKTNLRGETTYFSNEMLHIRVNKYLAVYKVPGTRRHPLFTLDC